MTKDPHLLNNVFGALLAAGWVVVIAALVGQYVYHPEAAAPERAFPIASVAPDSVPEAIEVATAEPGPTADIGTLLAAADAGAGEKVVRKCAACHSLDQGGPNKVGPTLWDIVNRPIGGHDGFNYSASLAGMGGEWSYEALDHFLAAPKDFAPGTKMTFAGVKNEADRANLIAYLRTLSADPAPLP